MTTGRLKISLALYAVLALLGCLLVSGDVLLVLLIFLGGLAAKSYIAWRVAIADAEHSGPEANP